MTAYHWAWVIAALAVVLMIWLVKRKKKPTDTYVPGNPREPKRPPGYSDP